MMPGVPSRNKGRGARRLVTNIHKYCKCGLKVPMADAKLYFRTNLSRGDGLADYCIKCEKEMQAKWRAKKKAEVEEEKARLGDLAGGSKKPEKVEEKRRCATCGFECKKSEASQYFKRVHRTCLKCEEDAITSLNAKWQEVKRKERKEIHLNGCTLLPGRDGQRCAKFKTPSDCEHYESCLDVVADRGWIGWKTVERKR